MTAPPDHSDEIRELVERGERDPRTHTFARLADLYRKTGELERALEVIEAGLKHHPHYLNARVVHARLLRELGRPGEAIDAFERVLEIDAQNEVARRALSEMKPTDPPVLTAREGKAGERESAGPTEADRESRDPSGADREGTGSRSTGWLASLDAAWRSRRGAEGPSREPPREPEESAEIEASEETEASDGAAVPVVAEVPAGTEVPGGAEVPAATEERSEADGAAATGTDSAASADPESRSGAGEDPADDEADVLPAGDRQGSAAPALRRSGEKLETATLARLYLEQGLVEEAIGIYERLLARDPYNARLATALEDARRRLRSGDRSTASAAPPSGSGGADTARTVPPARGDVGTATDPDTAVAAEPTPGEPARDRAGSDEGPGPEPGAPEEPQGQTKLEGPSRPAGPSIRAHLTALLEGRAEAPPEDGEWPDWLRRAGTPGA